MQVIQSYQDQQVVEHPLKKPPSKSGHVAIVILYNE